MGNFEDPTALGNGTIVVIDPKVNGLHTSIFMAANKL